jgi:hypothetical protein
MKLVTRIAAAALIGLGIGALDASAQTAPTTPPAPQAATVAPLSAEQVKTVLAGRLTQMRSDLKVGKVTEKDANTYDVELLRADGTVSEHALVDKLYAHPAGALDRGHHRMMGAHHGRFGNEGCGYGPGFGSGAGPGSGPGMMGGWSGGPAR